MKTNGPSAATAAAAVAGVLARPPRRATPETLSLDSVTTHRPTATPTDTAAHRTNTAATTLVRRCACTRISDNDYYFVQMHDQYLMIVIF